MPRIKPPLQAFRLSGGSSSHTADLIDKTCKSIEAGMTGLNLTVSSLEKVSVENRDTGKLISDISEASSEQAETIMQISSALEQISDVTQNNSVTAEEGAQTSRRIG